MLQITHQKDLTHNDFAFGHRLNKNNDWGDKNESLVCVVGVSNSCDSLPHTLLDFDSEEMLESVKIEE